MKIYILRHSETDWSRIGKLQGRTDIPLNDFGLKQVEALRQMGSFHMTQVAEYLRQVNFVFLNMMGKISKLFMKE